MFIWWTEADCLLLVFSFSWWTEAAALMGIPAGTAARGERTGWTGDAAFASESELFDFDTAAFFVSNWHCIRIVRAICTLRHGRVQYEALICDL